MPATTYMILSPDSSGATAEVLSVFANKICAVNNMFDGGNIVQEVIPAHHSAAKEGCKMDNKKLRKYLYQNPHQLIDYIFKVILPKYGYAVREEQIKLSKSMYDGLTGKQISINEAEVGTGKSLAYLVAGIVAKIHNLQEYGTHEPVTISTSSIELQKALTEKEIPKLSHMLCDFGIIDRPLSSVLCKGREHYLCKLRYEDYISKLKRNPDKYRDILGAIGQNGFTYHISDLDNASIDGRVKSRICVKDSCSKCRYRSVCRYYMYTKEALNDNSLDFQVVNHNLYLTSMRIRKESNSSGLLQSSSLVIIDEAHKFREAAQNVYSECISERDVRDYVNAVRYHFSDRNRLPEYKKLLISTEAVNSSLFDYLKKKFGTSEDEQNQMIAPDRKSRAMIEDTIIMIEKIEAMRNRNAGGQAVDSSKIVKSLRTLLNQSSVNIWLETDENKLTYLCSCPKSISKLMYNSVWNNNISHVLTSGTMSDGSSFDYFKSENGLSFIQKHLIKETQTLSPFDYRNHTRLYIPNDIPFPDNDSDDYINAVSERILQLIDATNGHTAILFTSYRVLHSIYELIAGKLCRYKVFCMTRSNRNAISDFKKSRNGVLFASGSMWEGVDCIGDCLSSVIIVRLPFPMRTAAMDEKKNACADIAGFIDTYVIPEMLLKLRQGVGRLIRSENDTGVISILDSRANSGIYKTRVESVLEKYPRVGAVSEIRDFIINVKGAGYFDN